MKVVEARTSKAPERYRIVRVRFRSAYRWWWDEPSVVGLMLEVTLLLIGFVIVFGPRFYHG